MAPTVLEAETCLQFGVAVIGRTEELVEEFFAVSVERRITHPCVVAITEAARNQLPVLFVIEDNRWAISTRTTGKTFYQHGGGAATEFSPRIAPMKFSLRRRSRFSRFE